MSMKCDCGNTKSRMSIKCRKCFALSRNGKGNPMWRGGGTSLNGNNKDICSCGREKTRISPSCRECFRKSQEGDSNTNWKGVSVGKAGLHEYIRTHKPRPEKCESCQKMPPKDLANVSGEYKRDINDFQWLCRLCHMTSDGRLEKLKHKNTMRKCHA
jgi:hypothetical protein